MYASIPEFYGILASTFSGQPQDRELHYRQTRIDQLTHEMAMIKRYQLGNQTKRVK